LIIDASFGAGDRSEKELGMAWYAAVYNIRSSMQFSLSCGKGMLNASVETNRIWTGGCRAVYYMQLVTESTYGVDNRTAFFGGELTTSGGGGARTDDRRPFEGLERAELDWRRPIRFSWR
jgi:hypothetical protein